MPPVRSIELGEFWGVLVAQLLLRDKIQDNIYALSRWPCLGELHG